MSLWSFGANHGMFNVFNVVNVENNSILGKSSDEIGNMVDNDPDALNLFLQGQHFKTFMFKLRTKVETYGDSQRNKITVQSAAPLNYKEYDDYLIKNIQRLTGVGKH